MQKKEKEQNKLNIYKMKKLIHVYRNEPARWVPTLAAVFLWIVFVICIRSGVVIWVTLAAAVLAVTVTIAYGIDLIKAVNRL